MEIAEARVSRERGLPGRWKVPGGGFIVKDFVIDIPHTREEKQRHLGQFQTSEYVASLMAGMVKGRRNSLRLLDAGAGDGSLTLALVKELCLRKRKPKSVSATLYEIDPSRIPSLLRATAKCQGLCEQAGVEFEAEVFNTDFIKSAVPLIRGNLYDVASVAAYDIAIVNPPYRKIKSDSEERALLRSAGIETVNLYAAFVALITRLLDQNGEIVAITPRSFANGPYFQSFRKDFLRRMSLRQLHVFDSRTAAFKVQDVLQENVIFHAVKNPKSPQSLLLSSSSGKENAKIDKKRVRYIDVIPPEDPECFIHFDIKSEHVEAEQAMKRLTMGLPDLGLTVSTGRVVEFRARPYIGNFTDERAHPLIHSFHFANGFIQWPKSGGKRPTTILGCEETDNLLLTSDTYVLVKRFSSKEERRRVVACVFDPARVKATRIGIENHLNYFHNNGKGLPAELAIGLAAYLNSTVVDTYFRRFSGHTQVNANDLRKLNYPSSRDLAKIGRIIGKRMLSQVELDTIITQELWGNQAKEIQSESLKLVN